MLRGQPRILGAMNRTRLRKPAIKHRRIGAWSELLMLENGRELMLRPISPLDAEPLRAGFSTLSADEVRMRFMHPIAELTPEYARQLTELDLRSEFALVACEPLPPGEALIGGVARLSFDSNTGLAEFALLVGRPLTGMGLGQYMLRKLIQWARRRRLKAIFGDVLHENTQMLDLAEQLGFTRRPYAEEPGVTRVWLDLKPAAASRMHAA